MIYNIYIYIYTYIIVYIYMSYSSARMAWKIWKRLMCTKTASKSSPSKNFKRAWCDMVRP